MAEGTECRVAESGESMMTPAEYRELQERFAASVRVREAEADAAHMLVGLDLPRARGVQRQIAALQESLCEVQRENAALKVLLRGGELAPRVAESVEMHYDWVRT